ncbi:hypothetical protein NDU88_004253 [Pleurodeles waltl]|uniref:Uncharacterized protein n=1 Tax=Pleurodeles waltl TaxID=8319 RepID=A0AAV7RKT1_PLEWA|nr:hypothetical protein NDU88_004253 [Pleurodeles waltl]
MGKLRHKIQGSSKAERGLDRPLTSGESEEGAAPDTIKDTLNTLNKILRVIEDTKLTLSQEIWKVPSELSHLRSDHHKLVDRVTTTETSLEELQPVYRALRAQVTGLSERAQVLERRAEAAEGHSRHNNIRFVGMPEGVEGTDAVVYLETWLRTIMTGRPLTPFFALERAHRVPNRITELGRLTRPIVAKPLYYRDRDLLLQLAREKGPFQVDGGNATFFPDFTLVVQNRWATFLEVKQALREEGLCYFLLFLSKLKVILDGVTHFFQEPDEVWTWLEAYHKGHTVIKWMEHKQPRRWGKR